MTRADCEADRISYGRFLLKLADPDEHPYRSFAGRDVSGALAFMTLLMLLPPLLAYTALRIALAVVSVSWRAVQSTVNSASRSRIDCGASATTSQYSSS